MPAKRPAHHVVKHHQKRQQSSSIIIYLFFFVLLILASITVIQTPTQDLRNFAEDITPTITPFPTSNDTPTPTLTLTPTPNISPTPMLRCGVPCTYNSQCPTGLFCYYGACRNPACSSQSDCACVITPTVNPYVPTATPRPTALPTAIPISTPRPIRTPTPLVFPTITSSTTDLTNSPTATPTPMSEIDKTAPKKISLLEAIIQFIGNIFCKLFRSC